MIALDLLDAPTARAAFEHSYRAAQVAGVTHVASISAALLARAMILGQDVWSARRRCYASTLLQMQQVNGLTRASLLAVYAELRLVQGAASEACSIAERLIVWAKSFRGGVPARLEHLRGECLAALGQAEAAEGSLRSCARIRTGNDITDPACGRSTSRSAACSSRRRVAARPATSTPRHVRWWQNSRQRYLMDPPASISRREWRSTCPQRGRLRLPAWREKRMTG